MSQAKLMIFKMKLKKHQQNLIKLRKTYRNQVSRWILDLFHLKPIQNQRYKTKLNNTSLLQTHHSILDIAIKTPSSKSLNHNPSSKPIYQNTQTIQIHLKIFIKWEQIFRKGQFHNTRVKMTVHGFR